VKFREKANKMKGNLKLLINIWVLLLYWLNPTLWRLPGILDSAFLVVSSTSPWIVFLTRPLLRSTWAIHFCHCLIGIGSSVVSKDSYKSSCYLLSGIRTGLG
jgi:hypothetical protein